MPLSGLKNLLVSIVPFSVENVRKQMYKYFGWQILFIIIYDCPWPVSQRKLWALASRWESSHSILTPHTGTEKRASQAVSLLFCCLLLCCFLVCLFFFLQVVNVPNHNGSPSSLNFPQTLPEVL